MVRWEMIAEGCETFETVLKNPNFAKLAEAYGMFTLEVNQHEDVPATITQDLR